MSAEPPARVSTLQAVLASEHAALYLYGVLGGRTSASRAPRLHDALLAAYRQHRARRDQLIGWLADADEQPEQPAAAYDLPDGVEQPSGPVGVQRAALAVEQRSAEAYADLVAALSGSQRAWAVEQLTDAAVRSLGFDGRPTALPGIDAPR